eukprot:CAMPEP_0113326314 /NCGR_PEP_ID=MMETSP0010_2-20120614/18423_1 /TAXON_ID=216773 ORGANISM="Corethron hystrix, Strain 308" /NCGR_SAMPLE_ID=MMETSP0010_2 /ASSEMBLY_ACC=CAM_ASM_000155 /LENGTH=100 /DNA_ID=CAMNT_0000186573 /DNA_START=132 /DNA_END=431 /DNA_ORIENTATION=+ /assembly_acc=CAM_ASM_000155
MGGMFYKSTLFNQNLSEWDVSKVTNMDNMFNGASSFNNCLVWDVGDVNTDEMFDGSNGLICTHQSLNPSTGPSWKPTLKPTLSPSTQLTHKPSMASSDVL